MNIATVSRSIELDYGHTLPNHFSFCNQIHGHRAKVTAVVKGEICGEEGSSNQGMVCDFIIIKKILTEEVHDCLDHGFAVWKDDEKDLEFIKSRNKRFLVTNEPPTAEYLAKWAFNKVKLKLPENIKLMKIYWQETPTSVAIYEGEK